MFIPRRFSGYNESGNGNRIWCHTQINTHNQEGLLFTLDFNLIGLYFFKTFDFNTPIG